MSELVLRRKNDARFAAGDSEATGARAGGSEATGARGVGAATGAQAAAAEVIVTTKAFGSTEAAVVVAAPSAVSEQPSRARLC